MTNDGSWAAPLPGETSVAHEALLSYCFMPPAERSLRALLRRYEDQAQTGTKPPTTSLRTLFGWSRQHQWGARVADFDAEERRKRIAQEQEARAKMNQRHIQTALALQGKVLEWLRDPTSRLEKPADVLLALRISVDIERKARGVPDALLQLTTLSDDELIARYTGLMRQVTGKPLVLTDEGDVLDQADDGE